MTLKPLIISFLFSPLVVLCQYTGGGNDGFVNTFLPKSIITDDNAFRGGSGDGYAFTNLPKTNITDANAFKGGNDDGFANTFLAKSNITDATAFRGGNDDGFANTFLAKINITDVNVFRGGIGRGEAQFKLVPITCDGTTVTWNGTVSNAWENPDNWNCGVIPNVSSIVIIPFGVPNYPKVNANYEIKTLYINANATITIQPGVQFKLNGQ